MRNLNILDVIAFILLVIGGINWGLIGLFDIDLVAAIFGNMSGISRLIYTLVGLSALYAAFVLPGLGHREELTTTPTTTTNPTPER